MNEELIKLDSSYIKPVSELLAKSFNDNPLMVYFFPKQETRDIVLSKILSGVVEIMMATGTVYSTSENLEGVIALKKCNNKKFNWKLIIPVIKMALKYLTLLKHVSFVYLIKKAHAITPTMYPKLDNDFYTIEMVAVDENYRNKGYMSKMIRAALKEVDRTNGTCVLHTETKINSDKYEHLGFKLTNVVESVPNELTQYVLIYDKNNKLCERTSI